MKLERATIPSDAVRLAALIYAPNVRRFRAPIVLSHGLTASKESLDLLAGYLAGRGHVCVSFDFRGHKLGGSTGDLNHAEEALSDLACAAAWARDRFREPRCVLLGHSMGALLGLVLAARGGEGIESVVAIATGPNPSKGFKGPIGQALMRQRGDYVSGVGPAALLAELDEMAQSVGDLGSVPSLFVAARGDALVKPSRMAELTARAGAHAELIEVDGSHLDAADSARGPIAGWLERNCAEKP